MVLHSFVNRPLDYHNDHALKLQNKAQEPESTYRLSFMQQGMLVHSLLYPGSGVDIEQLVLDLHERLDPLQFRQVWSQTMARHAVLRTGLRGRIRKSPSKRFSARSRCPGQRKTGPARLRDSGVRDFCAFSTWTDAAASTLVALHTGG